MDPVVTSTEAIAVFQYVLNELDGLHQRLPEGSERKEVGETLARLREPLLAAGKAASEAEAEIAATRQQAQEQLNALAIPEMTAPGGEVEAAATLGPRLREEVLRRYVRPAPAPVAATPPADDDRLTDNVGSIASQWSSWESTASSDSTSPPPSPSPAAPARTPGAVPKKTHKNRGNSDAWDDMSMSEE